mmetsp:Transcript_23078/g.46709  ORF Transcript_23078/g.46709 Transcript_23078/m.46709 type:complete len:353 (+) Transcript_23078:357-1415(+)
MSMASLGPSSHALAPTVCVPASVNTYSLAPAFTTLYPRIRSISSAASSPASVGPVSHPSFCTCRSFTTTLAPGAARITSAPSTVTLPWKEMSPSRTRDERAETLSSPPARRFFTSPGDVANEGCRMISGPNWRGTPANVPDAPPPCSTAAPAIRSISPFNRMASRSAVPAHSGGRLFRALAAASAMLFFTGEKHTRRSSSVKPTLAAGGKSSGKSCIMHSRRVGLLNARLVASAYLGFTNSLTIPPVASSTSTYRSMPNTRQLMFPGKGDVPVAGSATSPPLKLSDALSIGSSWLYSTLTVTLLPSSWSSLQMAPTASPGVRGTHTELRSSWWVWETPRTAGRARKMMPFVS